MKNIGAKKVFILENIVVFVNLMFLLKNVSTLKDQLTYQEP